MAAGDYEYYQIAAEDVLKIFKTSKQGLAPEVASKRLKQYSENKLEVKKRITPLMIFLNQFKSYLIAILIVAAVISALIGFWLDAVVILSIVVMNAALGFVQEYRAEKAVEALEKLTTPKANVLRNGRQVTIPSSELVPGDIVLLEAGDKVPADVRLIEVVNFKVDEAALTGESVPVEKFLDLIKKKVVVAERKNCAFMNTVVVNGRAKGIVVATGMQTEIGKIAHLIETASEKATPLQKSLAEVGKRLGAAIVVICAVIFTLGMLRGAEILSTFLSAVSLAVAAVPEGLPAVVTITLALGVSRLAKAKSIIRKLPAVETLGSCSFICCDKTGTLTKNEMTVKKVYVDNKILDVGGEGYIPDGKFTLDGKEFSVKDEHLLMALKIGALCNNATLYKDSHWKITGDPTEAALIVLARKAGIAKETLLKLYPEISEFSFDAERKRMSTIHKGPHGTWAFVKGAPDLLLKKCTHVFEGGRIHKLTNEKRKQLLKINEELASHALRILGLAFKELKDSKRSLEEVESNLVFVGLVGMIDPPRPEVRDALITCRSAGIKVSMVTGDHKLTATAIGQQLGLIGEGARVIDGDELEKMSNHDLGRICENVAIYARVTPEHKTRIVEALQKKGHIVAMTGDGVNDAPALKGADIGVAMGITGTDVAKEASAMILEDDNFATIVNAVKEGRGIYDNIKKFLRFLLSSNIGEVLAIFCASLIGLPLPLLAVQLLWINLLTDGLPAVALAVDPADPDIMTRKPRNPKEHTIDKKMIFTIALVGSVMAAGVLWLFWHALQSGASMDKARAIAFTAFVVFEMFNVFNTRSDRDSFVKGLFSNTWLLLAVASSIVLQMAVLYIPSISRLFSTAALGFQDWVWIIGIGFTIIIAEELRKAVFRVKNKST
ncbi:MAG: calcium-transporting P-type ATPase, PMR1-type [Candidatus Nanoarchaeia archaeon]